MTLMSEMNQKAWELGVPLSVHVDLTYRCNERCVHCYLDHEDHGEMTTAEIQRLLEQLAEAGVFFLVFSGGEVFLRRDFFELVEYARKLLFNVKIKTNAAMVRENEARRLRQLGVEQVQVSVYSHRAEIHDAITKLPGSFARTIQGIRLLQEHGLKVVIANVLMTANLSDYRAVQALGRELGVHCTVDPTVSPMMDGDRSTLALNIPGEKLAQVFQDEGLVGNVEEFCAPPRAATQDDLAGYPCSAGHTSCYVSPYGDVYPCVQFPLTCGNVRRQNFLDIWKNAPQLREVRSIRLKDLPTCSGCTHAATCTRCPGLAFLEGNMRGPSTADCEKSFRRTGIPSANMIAGGRASHAGSLVQIRGLEAGS
jgi:radical SAM protein with 4Fe4S-binding SPASM domain